MTKTTLMEFPCHFPIKIMGTNTPAFLDEIKAIATAHFPEIELDAVTSKHSKAGNYLAITVTVYAENQEMLDAFYRDITKHPEIKMVL
ncbi:MAG: DUF493 domain-containing protein [Legionella sp.]|jgi:putative lipoic acid-binding regulatory protein|nr:DUF493 domain-containing protein [Legionella sp.]